MLTRPEREAVTADLAGVLLIAPTSPQGIQSIFGDDTSIVLRDISLAGLAPNEVADRVIGVCMDDRWRRQPDSLLEVLLSGLIGRGVDVAALTPIRDRVRAKTDPNLGPLTSSWITADKPFFGRSKVRSVVQKLLDSSELPILMVQGVQNSGKTYTSDWLDYLASPERCDFRIVIESLEAKTGATMEPDILVESLCAKMGGEIDRSLKPGVQRYEQRLCNTLVSVALKGARRTWIVLDGFDDPDLHEGTKTLIQLLAKSVLSGDLNRRVRLVLIDFKSKLAQVEDDRISCDGLPDPNSIQAHEIEACLQQHFDDIKKPVEREFVRDLAVKLVTDADNLRRQPAYSAEPLLKLVNRSVKELRKQELAQKSIP